MGKILAIICLLVVVGYGVVIIFNKAGGQFGFDQIPFLRGSIKVSSKDFQDGERIPVKFTCDGEDVSPSLSITNIPSNTESLAVVMEDKTTKPPFTHWLVFNVSHDTSAIDSSQIYINGTEGLNDYGRVGYDGPCPPLGETHHYYFRVLALNKKFDQLSLNRGSFDYASQAHVLASGFITGVYSKNP